MLWTLGYIHQRIKMEFMYIVIMCLTFCYLPQDCFAAKYEGVTTQTCEMEEFKARCSYNQYIFITEALYGHIQISRCVVADFGHFGCHSDVKDIISERCSGKSRCEFMFPDPEIAATKSCLTGLRMYLDTTYVCLPKLLPQVSCSGIPVTNSRQYVTSQQILSSGCGPRFLPNKIMKVKLTFSKISQSTTENYNGSDTLGFVVSMDGVKTPIIWERNKDELEIVSSHNEVIIEFTKDLSDVLLIGFQATGCEDVVAPPYAFIERDGDKATLTCEYSDYTWQLSCVGTRWIGGMGNCTKQVQKEIYGSEPEEKKEIPQSNEEKEILSSEILFALIIGITFFLCAMVVIIGFVCVKRAKYASKTSKKERIELNSVMLEGDGTSSWRKTTFNRNELNVNGENQPLSWQQTLPQHLTNGNGTLPPNTQKYFILDRDG